MEYLLMMHHWILYLCLAFNGLLVSETQGRKGIQFFVEFLKKKEILQDKKSDTIKKQI